MYRYFLVVAIFSVWTSGCEARSLDVIDSDYAEHKQLYAQSVDKFNQAKQKLINLESALTAAQADLQQKQADLASKSEIFKHAQALEKLGYSAREPREVYFAALRAKQDSETAVAQQQMDLLGGREQLQQAQLQVQEKFKKLQTLQMEKAEARFAIIKQQIEQEKTVEISVELGCDQNWTLKQCREQVLKLAQRRAVERGSAVLVDAVSLAQLQKQGLRLTKDEIRTEVSGLLLSHRVLDEGFTRNGSYFYELKATVKGQVPAGLKARFFVADASIKPPEDLADILKPFVFESVFTGTYKVGETFQLKLKDGSLGPKMVVIPKGSFRMGDIQGGGYDNEKPVHKVTINYDFAMSQYEVTKGEFAQFIQATSYQTDAEKGYGCYGWTGSKWEQKKEFNWRNVGFEQENNHPAVCLSWNDAKAYTKWLSEQTGHECRLPTEAEWEYAARAGTETKYWWGNEGSHEYMNFFGTSGKDKWKYTSPVGSFKANPFGLYDMNGNVWEWCEDSWHDNYNGAPTDGSAWKKSNENRSLLRGGSWYNVANRCRSANRLRSYRDVRLSNGGVRLVCGVRA
jgi:formylglycine-generating enzyme required for sulfatase activity